MNRSLQITLISGNFKHVSGNDYYTHESYDGVLRGVSVEFGVNYLWKRRFDKAFTNCPAATTYSSHAANPSTRGAGTHPDHNHAIDREIN